MKRTLNVGALCVAGTFALATAGMAQDPSANQSTTTTQSTTMHQTTTARPISGRVVRYEAGKSIAVVGSDGREQTYQLSTSTSVPSDVAVGRTVSIVTEPSASGSGSAVVTRITTTSVGSDGSMKTETQTHVNDPNASAANPSTSWEAGGAQSSAQPMAAGQSTSSQSTTTQTTTMSNDGTITGTVSAYEPGKSVTFVLPDKRTVVYTIDSSSSVPSDIAVGKTYSVTTVKSTTGGNQMTVKKITTTTTKTTTQSNP
jgi:hypothetical protein